MRALALVVTALAATGCAASLRPAVAYRSSSAESAADRDVTARAESSAAWGSDAHDPSIAVFVDRAPEGVAIDGDEIHVATGYAHVVVGSFRLYIPTDGISSPGGPAALFAVRDYVDSWRGPFCAPQVVLTWATLFLWSLSPTAWPCWAADDIDRRDVTAGLAAIAKAAGGDAAIASYHGAAHGISVAGRGSATGWVVRLDPRVKAALAAASKP